MTNTPKMLARLVMIYNAVETTLVFVAVGQQA